MSVSGPRALVPHPSRHAAAGSFGPVSVRARALRSGDALAFEYELIGDTRAVVLPADVSAALAQDRRQRQDGLWKTTCWEAFVGSPGDSRYVEFNFSPFGDWNAYQFSAYREGMADANVTIIGASVRTGLGPDGRSVLAWRFEVRPDDRLSFAGPLEISLAAVLARSNSDVLHLALTHVGDTPDFHLRASFIDRLPPVG